MDSAYIRLFLEKKPMKKISVIKKGVRIELMEFVPDILIVLAERTNNILSKLRAGMKTWFTSEANKVMNISIWVYEDDTPNAFTQIYANEHVIGISLALCLKMYQKAEEFVDNEDSRRIFNISENKRDMILDELYFVMLNFVISHEVGHIAHGHLKMINNQNYICELDDIKEIDRKPEANWAIQLRECDADYFAAMLSATICLEHGNDSLETLKVTFDFWMLALYMCFSIFAENSKKNYALYSSLEITEYDHPHPGIRLTYCTYALFYTLLMFHDNEDENNIIIQSGYHTIISYDKEILNKKEMKDCYYSVAFTEKGSQHIMNLTNQWNEQIDKYNKVSYIAIPKIDMIDILPAILDTDGT